MLVNYKLGGESQPDQYSSRQKKGPGTKKMCEVAVSQREQSKAQPI